MAYNERSSETLAELAARLMHHPEADVRRLAGSVLTQAPDNAPKNAMGAHRRYNGGNAMRDGNRALALYTLAAGGRRRDPGSTILG